MRTSGTRADAEGTRRETPWGARQAMSSLEPWSIAFRIWSACVVLGSSLRSSATNSSRLALMPRTSSNEAKYASASATDNLNAFGSSVSTKETIHWMQSSRATMTPSSRGPVRQSRCAPLRGLEFHPHLASSSTTEAPAQHSIQQAWYKVPPRREPTAGARQKAVVSAKAELRQGSFLDAGRLSARRREAAPVGVQSAQSPHLSEPQQSVAKGGKRPSAERREATGKPMRWLRRQDA